MLLQAVMLFQLSVGRIKGLHGKRGNVYREASEVFAKLSMYLPVIGDE